MKVFTIENGRVTEGAKVTTFTLKNADVKIPAIIVGEEGRGRERGVLPVVLTNNQHREWQETGSTCIQFAQVGTTSSGKPKLFSSNSDADKQDDRAICVFYTKIGYRGGNNHTGDRTGEETYDDCGIKKTRPTFAGFPGEVLVLGKIAQGDAGRMGSGDQTVAIMPKGVFRTSYKGRLYDQPSAHYYCWDGQRVLGGVTWDERRSSEIF